MTHERSLSQKSSQLERSLSHFSENRLKSNKGLLSGNVLKVGLKNIPKRIHLTPAFFPKSMSQKDICGETKSCCSPEGIFFKSEIGRKT